MKSEDIDFSGVSGRMAPDGSMRLEWPDGSTTIIRGVAKYGKDGRDGKDGVAPTVPEIVRAIYKPKDGKDGRDGDKGDSIKGDRGESSNGLDGKDGLSIKGEPGTPGKNGVGVNGKDGRDGKDGTDGGAGPVPRHEVDPPYNPYRIRFEIRQHPSTGKIVWGEWIDFRKLLPKVLPRQKQTGGGHVLLNRQQIIDLINDTVSTNPVDGYLLQDENSDQAVKYFGYQKVDGRWYIRRADDATEPATYRFTNTGAADYISAWTTRTSLTYGYLAGMTNL